MKPGVGLKYGPPVTPPPTTHSSDLGAYLRLMWQVCAGEIDVSPDIQLRCSTFFLALDKSWSPLDWDGQPTQVEMTHGNLAGLTPNAQATAVLIYEILTPVGTPSKPGERVHNAPWWWLTWVDNAGREQPAEKREAVLRDLWARFKDSAGAAELLKKINAALAKIGAKPIETAGQAPSDERRTFVLADLEMLLGKELAEAVWQLGAPVGRSAEGASFEAKLLSALKDPLPALRCDDLLRSSLAELCSAASMATPEVTVEIGLAIGHAGAALSVQGQLDTHLASSTPAGSGD